MRKRRAHSKFSGLNLNFLKKVNIFKFLSIALIIFFVFYIPAVLKRLVNIKNIECQSQFGPCNISFQVGRYDIVKKQIQDNLGNNVKVSSYLVQYKIPSTVKIDLILKEPRYVVKSTSGYSYKIDRDGLVLEIGTDDISFDLLYDLNATLGAMVDQKAFFALRLIDKIKIINSISSARIENDVLIINFSNGVKCKLPIEGDIDVLAGSLRLIFSRLNEGRQGIRMEDVHEIDLRFKNPVLR